MNTLLLKTKEVMRSDCKDKSCKAQKVASFYLLAMVERTGIEPVTPTMST